MQKLVCIKCFVCLLTLCISVYLSLFYLSIIYLSPFMGRLGFEPRTNRLKAECSTAELATLACQANLNTLAQA